VGGIVIIVYQLKSVNANVKYEQTSGSLRISMNAKQEEDSQLRGNTYMRLQAPHTPPLGGADK
jgi:hypothetical protein